MDECKLAALAAQSPIDPLKIEPTSIILSSQHLGVQSVRFWYRQGARGELYLPPQTHHIVTVQLQDAPKFIQARGGCCHEAPVHKGEVLVVRAEQPSFWYREGMRSLHIALDPCFVQRVALEACDTDPARVELLDVFSTRDPILHHLAQLFMTELHTGTMGGPLYAESLGNVLALHLLRTYCTQWLAPKFCKGGLPPHHVRRVVEYIHAHLAEPLTLVELAGLLQMSQAHFIRAFQHTMGCTPHQYVIQCRIEQAKTFLSTPGVPIGAVASRVGFQTHSHFTVFFRKLTGVSPTAYRHAQLARSMPSATPADTNDPPPI
jgi:AraC family transcriptional regulator